MTPSAPTPRLQRSRLARLLVALIVMVPLVLAAVYMWVLWDPTPSVKHLPVAIVNEDQGFVDDEGTTAAGQSITDNLVKSGSLKFSQESAATAYSGLDADKYYFVIDIPRDFSKNLKNITEPDAIAQLITVTFNDNNTLKASQIGGSAMEKIFQKVLQGVASTTVGGLVDGVQQLGDGLRTAADGSGQLADGTSTLSSGIVNDLAPGVERAREGAARLDDGAGTLAAGLVTLQGGTDQLGAGATELADGIERLTSMVPLETLKDTLAQAQQVLPDNSSLTQIATLVEGLGRLQTGSRELASQLTDPSFSYRSGVDRLVAGSATLSDGTGQLSEGMVTLQEGVAKLSEGATRLDDGAKRLNQGLSDGAEKAPNFGDKDARTTLAELMATPVAKETTFEAQAQFGGPGGAPTILLVASMLVPIAIALSFRGHRFVTDDERPRSLKAVGRRAVAVGAISLAAVAVVGVLAFLTRDPVPEPSNLGRVIAITAVATLMNAALVSLLFTVFGYIVGALSSLSWMMLQLFSYGGIWMVETVPKPFQWLNPVSPLTYVRDGFIAAFNGVAGFGTAMFTLGAILVVALAALFAVVRFQQGRSVDGDVIEADDGDTRDLAQVPG